MYQFYSAHPNTELVQRIEGTSYAFYRLKREALPSLVAYLERSGGEKGDEMPKVWEDEFITFRYGAMRHATFPANFYNHDLHKH